MKNSLYFPQLYPSFVKDSRPVSSSAYPVNHSPSPLMGEGKCEGDIYSPTFYNGETGSEAYNNFSLKNEGAIYSLD